MLRNKINWSLIILIGSISISCAPIKKAKYFNTFQEIEDINTPEQVYFIEKDNTDMIHPGDELYITVASGNDDPNSFNQSSGPAINDIDLLSYIIDNEGYAHIPYIGRMKLSGLTINEAINSLEEKLSQYLYLPSVSMRFINNRITVLGETNAPGVYVFNRKSVNIYQVIGYAGDISPFGDRKNVLIVRQEGNIIKKKHVDLTNDEILTSSWFYIQPNDIIYVEPLMRKRLGLNTVDYGLFFSILSTAIVMYTFIISLKTTN